MVSILVEYLVYQSVFISVIKKVDKTQCDHFIQENSVRKV
jgi:hypothetical protein